MQGVTQVPLIVSLGQVCMCVCACACVCVCVLVCVCLGGGGGAYWVSACDISTLLSVYGHGCAFVDGQADFALQCPLSLARKLVQIPFLSDVWW